MLVLRQLLFKFGTIWCSEKFKALAYESVVPNAVGVNYLRGVSL